MTATNRGLVLVTGATGAVGRTLPGELARRGVRVRALVRDPGRAAAVLGDRVELAEGDFADRATVHRAMNEVDRVFLCSTNHPRQVEYEQTVIDAAAAAEVRRVVKVGNQGARAGSPVAFWNANGRIEEHLKASRLPWVVLHPSSYLTNLLAGAQTVRENGLLLVPAGDARITLMDPRDVAATAAEVLCGDGHEGRTYTLTGPDAVTMHEVAKDLSAVIGRPVEYVDVPDDAARAGMVQAGVPAWTAEQIMRVWGEVRGGALSVPTDVVAALTGIEPRSVAAFLADHAEAFR